MAFHAPLDLYYWLVTTFAGNITIFIVIAIIFTIALGAYFRMSGLVIGVMFSLFIVMLMAYTGNIYLLVIFVIALAIGWAISRFTR